MDGGNEQYHLPYAYNAAEIERVYGVEDEPALVVFEVHALWDESLPDGGGFGLYRAQTAAGVLP